MSENKKPYTETSASAPPQRDGLPLPDEIILEVILPRLEHVELMSVSSVCRNLRSAVAQVLPNQIKSLDLSAFSPDGDLLHHIVDRLHGVESVFLDCLSLDDFLVTEILLGPRIKELYLLKGASLSSKLLASIGENCPDLRTLYIELAGIGPFPFVTENIVNLLERCDGLKHLSITVRNTERVQDAFYLTSIDHFLPKTLTLLKLQPVNELSAVQFFERLGDERTGRAPRPYLSLSGFSLLQLSLVLNVISDRLIISIATALPNLIELNLEDRPWFEPSLPDDLTSRGILYLRLCRILRHLSLVRSQVNRQVSFKRFDDIGMMHLSRSCGRLESIKLGGFSRVTGRGFSWLPHRCHNLKKFEIQNAPLLSDLTLATGVAGPLMELRVQFCSRVTGESVAELASSTALKVLDTNGCTRVADSCLEIISRIGTLTWLNLGGANITDSGLLVLSKGDLPITKLCLSRCVGVTDRGIISLINGGERIKKMLKSLDVGYIPGVSDSAIHAIVSSCEALTDLCMRYCTNVTDAGFAILASGRVEFGGRSKFIRRLDVCHCTGLSDGVMKILHGEDSFGGLKWLGVGGTKLAEMTRGFNAIYTRRPWLTICFKGCELGCNDQWQVHKEEIRGGQ